MLPHREAKLSIIYSSSILKKSGRAAHVLIVIYMLMLWLKYIGVRVARGIGQVPGVQSS